MKRVVLLSVVCCLLLLTGCVKESVDGETKVFTFEASVSLGALVACLIGMTAGWFLRRTSVTWGWGLLIVAPLAMVIFVPALFIDEVRVSNDEFTLKTGFWFAPTVREVHFDDLRMVQLTKKETRGRRGRKNTSYDFVCHGKSGEPTTVPIVTIMEEAAESIAMQFAAHNIPIQDLTGE